MKAQTRSTESFSAGRAIKRFEEGRLGGTPFATGSWQDSPPTSSNVVPRIRLARRRSPDLMMLSYAEQSARMRSEKGKVESLRNFIVSFTAWANCKAAESFRKRPLANRSRCPELSCSDIASIADAVYSDAADQLRSLNNISKFGP